MNWNLILSRKNNQLVEIPQIWLSEAKLKARSKAARQNIFKFDFDAKLRFRLFASLHSAIFEIFHWTTSWSLSPEELIPIRSSVKFLKSHKKSHKIFFKSKASSYCAFKMKVC